MVPGRPAAGPARRRPWGGHGLCRDSRATVPLTVGRPRPRQRRVTVTPGESSDRDSAGLTGDDDSDMLAEQLKYMTVIVSSIQLNHCIQLNHRVIQVTVIPFRRGGPPRPLLSRPGPQMPRHARQ
jgi:hypothetical protein